MPVDYPTLVFNLKQALPFVISVAVIEGEDIVYSTDDWNIKADIGKILAIWDTMKPQPVNLLGVNYLTRTCTSDRFIATSIKRDGHIVGVKKDEKILLSSIEPDGIIPFTTTEMVRALSSLSTKEPYLDENIQLGQKANIIGNGITDDLNIKTNEQEKEIEETDIPFTARLMAYYRAQEYKRDYPLISDPFAERLAGDLSAYLKKHIRISQMDYPIVRSHYIEKNLLTPWCNIQKESQIVILGAGLDTRAYRFKPLQINTHTVLEIDFPSLIRYKEELLHNEQPLCELVRLSIDLTKADWTIHLIKEGFSQEVPTFWVLEGIIYYILQDEASSLLEKAAEISIKDSQIFADILQSSRWYPFYFNENSAGPYAKHLKWGLDIRYVPTFFESTGWDVMCSWADDHDQGRDVGQKGMIFIEGVKK